MFCYFWNPFCFITFLNSLDCCICFYFLLHKEYMIWQISFSKFSDVVPAFTCARAIGNLWNICLRVNILSCLRSATLATRAKFKWCLFLFVCLFYWKYSTFKAIKMFLSSTKMLCLFSKSAIFFSFLSRVFGFVDYLNLSVSF